MTGVLEQDDRGRRGVRPTRAGRLARGGGSVFRLISTGAVLFMAALALYPLARILLRVAMPDGSPELSGFNDAFQQPGLAGVLATTVLVVSVSGVAALLVGGLMAWLSERTDGGIGPATGLFALMPFLMPNVAGAIGWTLLLSDRSGFLNVMMRSLLERVGVTMAEGPLNIYTRSGMIFVYTIYMVPYVYLMVSSGLRNMDPALEEQSRVCGAGPRRTVWRVTFQAIKPSLGAAALLVLWFGMALFSVPAIIGTGPGIEVLSVRIVNLLGFTFPPETQAAVGLSILVLATLVTAWMIQGRILRNRRYATVGGKGARPSLVALGRWKLPARVFLWSYIVVAAVMPLAALVVVALNGFWTPNIDWGGLSLETFDVAFSNLQTRRAFSNSLGLGLFGATLGIVMAALLALYVQRTPGRVGRLLDGAVKLPAAASHVVIGVGFIIAFGGPPFSLAGTWIILLLAYLVMFMPQASVAADAAAAQVGGELREASAVSGARGGRTFMRISFPLMLPGLAAGWGLLFIGIMSELTASSIISTPRNTVVSLRLLEIYQGGSYGPLAALALGITLLNAVVVAGVVVLTRRRKGLGLSGPQAGA